MNRTTFLRGRAVGDRGSHQRMAEPKGLAVHAEKPGRDRVAEIGRALAPIAQLRNRVIALMDAIAVLKRRDEQ